MAKQWAATRTCKPVENYYSRGMAKKAAVNVGQASSLSPKSEKHETGAKSGVASSLRLEKSARSADTTPRQKPSSLLDTRVIYCGDNLEQLAKLPDACVDLIYIDPPFNSNRNYEVFWGETGKSAPLKTATRTPGLTLTTCARAACNSPASSKRPAAFITTATGTPATTLRRCSMNRVCSAKIISNVKSSGIGRRQRVWPLLVFRTTTTQFSIMAVVMKSLSIALILHTTRTISMRRLMKNTACAIQMVGGIS